MPMHPPFNLGPFTVDGEGRVAPRDQETFPAFNVLWRGRSVRAQITHGAPSDGHLQLRAVLGRVPSTAGGGTRTGLRELSFASLRAIQRDLPQDWHVSLLPNHSAMLEAETGIDLPITAIGLVTEITGFLLTLAPYLDLLDEGGMPGAAAGSGKAKA
jgi:hypothetical protein